MSFFTALQSMASLTFLIAIGYVIARKGWISLETEAFLLRFLIQVALPPYLMAGIINHFQHDQFLQLIEASLLPFSSICLSFLVFRMLASILGVAKEHRNLLGICVAVSNAIFIGIPVGGALFGEQAVPVVLLYFFPTTLFFWGVGGFILSRENNCAHSRPSFLAMVRQVVSPPLRGSLVGVLLLLLDIHLPSVVLDTCNYLGALTSPLALVYLGSVLSRIDWHNANMGKDVVVGAVCRLACGPLMLLCLLQVMPLPADIAKVFIVQAALPTMANLPLLAAMYSADRQYASMLVAVTTVGGMLTVPVWMGILPLLLP